MDVLPFTGFGSVRLGMSREQVLDILGNPLSVAYGERKSDIDEVWHFDGFSCDFFEDDDGRLGSATFESPRFHVDGVELVGITEQALLALPLTKGISLDGDFPFVNSRNYKCDPLGLSFWITDGIVDSMTIFPRYDASGDVLLWPRPE